MTQLLIFKSTLFCRIALQIYSKFGLSDAPSICRKQPIAASLASSDLLVLDAIEERVWLIFLVDIIYCFFGRIFDKYSVLLSSGLVRARGLVPSGIPILQNKQFV